MSNVDQKIENAANKIESAANKAWEKRSFRIVSKSISAAAEIGLMIGITLPSCVFLENDAICVCQTKM